MKKIAIVSLFCATVSAEQVIDFNSVLREIQRNDPNLSPISLVPGYASAVQELQSRIDNDIHAKAVTVYFQAEEDLDRAPHKSEAYTNAKLARDKAFEIFKNTQYYQDSQKFQKLYEKASNMLISKVQSFKNQTDADGYSLLDNAVARGLYLWVYILLKAGTPVTEKTLMWLGSPQMQTKGMPLKTINAINNNIGIMICQTYEFAQKKGKTQSCNKYRQYYSASEIEQQQI